MAKKPVGYWRDGENLGYEMQLVIESLGHFPTQKELIALGRNDMIRGIANHHGGLNNVREMMGYEVEHPRSSRDYLKDESNAVEEAQQAMEDNGWDRLPGSKNLCEAGYSHLDLAITRHHGGYHNFRKKLGDESKMGKWRDLDYVLEQARKAMSENDWDRLPAAGTLKDAGYATLATSIPKYHGGIRNVRELLGQEQGEMPKGVWKSLDFALSEARKAMSEEGWSRLPCASVLRENHASLASSITRYHGGFRKFRGALGEEQKERKKGVLRDEEYVLSEIVRIMAENDLSEMPTQVRMAEMGQSSLNVAITTYHGGRARVKELIKKRLGQPTEREGLEGLLDDYVDGGGQ